MVPCSVALLTKTDAASSAATPIAAAVNAVGLIVRFLTASLAPFAQPKHPAKTIGQTGTPASPAAFAPTRS